VFQPVPNVDSSLVLLRRARAAPAPIVRELVRAAFAHRRKSLSRSLELWARDAEHGRKAGTKDLRAAARAALELMGHPANERAERLAPQEFVDLAGKLAGT
jgi:16S rRNA (adenine1518-N6/adenine1519-N6)-dimethyltransferase